jgi:hypothetical protein
LHCSAPLHREFGIGQLNGLCISAFNAASCRIGMMNPLDAEHHCQQHHIEAWMPHRQLLIPAFNEARRRAK